MAKKISIDVPKLDQAYGDFGRAVYTLLASRGWNSLGKRELLIELLHAAQHSGLLNLSQGRLRLAATLRVSPAVVDGWLRDLHLLKDGLVEPPVGELVEELRRADRTSADDLAKGQWTFAVPDVRQRMQIEMALARLELVPDYRNNRALLVLDGDQLLLAISRATERHERDLLLAVYKRQQTLAAALHAAAGAQTHLMRALGKVAIGLADKVGTPQITEGILELITLGLNAVRRKDS